MSYCRVEPGVSDVYVYHSDVYVCGSCKMARTDDWEPANILLETPVQMLAHLTRHRVSGHLVPDAAIERLQRDCQRGRYEPE